MTDNQLIALLRLQAVPGIGAITAKKLIAYCGSPAAVFTDETLRDLRQRQIKNQLVYELGKSRYLRAAMRELEFIRSKKIKTTYCGDPNYPQGLTHCPDSPILLFYKGNIQFHQTRMISVVGTRSMTSRGAEFCNSLIEGLARYNPTVVSGFAYGVDICAQRAAVRCGLQTIGCLAHGLNQIYPRAHEADVDEVCLNGGFVTEFWSQSRPDRENFLQRNRIIAGLSLATVVVESAERGGSLVTAEMANGYNRDVFAVPGRSSDPYSSGCNALIRDQKAQLIGSAAELAEFLGWSVAEVKTPPVQKQLFPLLDGAEKEIHDFLNKSGKQELDSIALSCKIPVYKVSSVLLKMEMKGLIRPLPGKVFEVV